MKRARVLVVAMGVVSAWSPASRADDAGAPDAGARLSVTATCSERWPEGKPRPRLEESFPAKGTSGYAANLRVVIEHGKGETVMPNGFRVQLDTEAARALEHAGFALPDPDGGAGPNVKVETKGEMATSTLEIPVLLLPEGPGRNTLDLPPLPVAIARASGEILTLCTKQHRIVVDDPIASTPDPKPRDNPPPRPQREIWTTAKEVTIAALIALLVGALLAWLIGRWLRRPRPVPPPPPPRPPWELALEELSDIRAAELIENERFVEHFERVAHVVRRYCGDRYGFDGLESTTREILSVLRRVVPRIAVLDEIEKFLRHADLVKFARLTPSAEECLEALERGDTIVRRTIPFVPPPQPAAPEAPPPPPPAAPGSDGGPAANAASTGGEP